MNFLWQENGLSIGEIANRSKKDFAKLTMIVDKLIKSGYFRKSLNSKHSRSINIHILPKADEIKEKIQTCWELSSNISLAGISDVKKQFFLQIIDKIENNVLMNLR
jgi:DNA-binding MarR family transcriptional regulator